MVCGEVEMALLDFRNFLKDCKQQSSAVILPLPPSPALPQIRSFVLRKLPSPCRAVGHDALNSHLLAPYAIVTLNIHMEKSYGKPKENTGGSMAVLA